MYSKLYSKLNNSKFLKTATIINGEYISSKISINSNNTFDIECGNCPESVWKEVLPQLVDTTQSKLLKFDDIEIVVEVIYDTPRMVILGGGHVSHQLAYIANQMGFYLTIVDDREEFANLDRFKFADNIICKPYSEAFDMIENTYNTYYVIVTRGHVYDSLCLEKCLERNSIYIGMIGSKGKVAQVFDNLIAKGYDKTLIDKVHSPIGLKLGGNLPMEVAVSIAAEIIQIRNSNSNQSVDIDIKNYFVNKQYRKGDKIVTIIEKSGSSPRGVGSKMIIKTDGTILGSIGGGNVEFEAINQSKLIELPTVCRYDLSNKEGAKLGMTCGGHVSVFYEII